MEINSIATVRKELNQTEREELISICLRLARYKKENKESQQSETIIPNLFYQQIKYHIFLFSIT